MPKTNKFIQQSDLTLILSRLDTLEQQLLLHRATSDVSERLAALESKLQKEIDYGKALWAPSDLSERLAAVERRLDSLTVAWNNSSATARPDVSLGRVQPQAPQPAAPEVSDEQFAEAVAKSLQLQQDLLSGKKRFNFKPTSPAKVITPEQVQKFLFDAKLGSDDGSGKHWQYFAARINDFFGGK